MSEPGGAHGAPRLKIYGFWRSQATFRVRVALNLKGLAYDEVPIDIDSDAIDAPSFRAINPMGSVPALMVGDEPLTQSLAILEYLDETHPQPALLPPDPLGRARVRALAALVVSDSHPLIVPRVRRYLVAEANFDSAMWRAWQVHWFTAGLRGFEARLASSTSTGTYCHGENLSLADICLAGLVAGARQFDVPTREMPTIERIVERCMADPCFERAGAIHQSDYPRAS